ncbi:hypothetical protein [Gemmatimonas sp.]|uniref:hypothetical protein n=1 Tax=Gemmatimonas sp. TaxID=1962908 RepID=UPI0022BCF085|nr:hypothetical protein [Gemmatimonas sp.]MCZ8013961.1 hypothetical protein [Gemmatimonas sp.]
MPLAHWSSHPYEREIDLDFRPESYVADWCVTASIIQNVAGEARRERLFERLASGGTGLIDPRFLADRLTDELRIAVIAADPVWNISGEYLPPCVPFENEIARMVLGTTPRAVYSVRVAPYWPSKEVRSKWKLGLKLPLNRLRIVDDHGEGVLVDAVYQRGGECRSLREVVRSIDSAWGKGTRDLPRHIPFPERMVLWRAEQGVAADELPGFVRLYSAVYPELAPYYSARIARWVEREFTPEGQLRRPLLNLSVALHSLWQRGRQ